MPVSGMAMSIPRGSQINRMTNLPTWAVQWEIFKAHRRFVRYFFRHAGLPNFSFDFRLRGAARVARFGRARARRGADVFGRRAGPLLTSVPPG